MRRVWHATALFFRMVWEDGMLAAAAVAPVLCGLLFRYGAPALVEAWPPAAVLPPYYQLLDALLLLLTPYMLLFTAAMLLLSERDAGVSTALYVTPLRRGGYLAARLLLPALLAAGYGLAVIRLFALVARPLWQDALLSLLCALVSCSCLLFVATFARDKVQGMALAKAAGLVVATVALPYFVPATWHPWLGALPTYWLVRALRVPDAALFLAGAVTALFWMGVWWLPFRRRMR